MKISIILLLACFSLQGFSQEISKKYDKIGPFKSGVAVVWENGLCGLISSSGAEILKPQFEKIGSFGNDALAYTTKQGKRGMINLEGKVVVPNIYDHISGFNGFYAVTEKNGLAGLINKKGQVVFDNTYESIKIGKYGEIRAVKDGQMVLLNVKDK